MRVSRALSLGVAVKSQSVFRTEFRVQSMAVASVLRTRDEGVVIGCDVIYGSEKEGR